MFSPPWPLCTKLLVLVCILVLFSNEFLKVVMMRKKKEKKKNKEKRVMKKIKEKREKIIKEKNQKKYTKILKQKMLMKNHETDNPFITCSVYSVVYRWNWVSWSVNLINWSRKDKEFYSYGQVIIQKTSLKSNSLKCCSQICILE